MASNLLQNILRKKGSNMISNAFKYLISFFTVILFTGLSYVNSKAITYDLDCTITGVATCDSSETFGTISFTDNGNYVDVEIELVGDGVHRVQSIYLNYDPELFDSDDLFLTIPAGYGVVNVEDYIKPDGYGRAFDLMIPKPPPGNLGFEPVSFSIALAGVDLDPENFGFLDELGNIYTAVHIGNYGDAPGQPGRNSIWVGSSGDGQIPEPDTIILIGIGLFGFGIYKRRVLKKQG
jgi:hypothetical protein